MRDWITQEVTGCDVNISKLMTILRVTFGESFDICMMHNGYHVEAPRSLTEVSLSCLSILKNMEVANI